jgi:hypothetical protein
MGIHRHVDGMLFFTNAFAGCDFINRIRIRGSGAGNFPKQPRSISPISMMQFSTTISGFDFDATTCSDFSIGNVPENLTIAPQASLSVEIVYTPTFSDLARDTLKIYNGTPFASTELTFSGTGIEAPAGATPVSRYSQKGI